MLELSPDDTESPELGAFSRLKARSAARRKYRQSLERDRKQAKQKRIRQRLEAKRAKQAAIQQRRVRRAERPGERQEQRGDARLNRQRARQDGRQAQVEERFAPVEDLSLDDGGGGGGYDDGGGGGGGGGGYDDGGGFDPVMMEPEGADEWADASADPMDAEEESLSLDDGAAWEGQGRRGRGPGGARRGVRVDPAMALLELVEHTDEWTQDDGDGDDAAVEGPLRRGRRRPGGGGSGDRPRRPRPTTDDGRTRMERLQFHRANRIRRGRLLVHAARGTRAAVLPLTEGLLLVGEVPESLADDVGFLPLLLPLMANAARKSLANAPTAPADGSQKPIRLFQTPAPGAAAPPPGAATPPAVSGEEIGRMPRQDRHGRPFRNHRAPPWLDAEQATLAGCECHLLRAKK